MAQLFKQQGYATGAVVSSFVLDRSWGLARGFDFYDDAFSAESFQQKEIGLVDRSAGESVTRALRWLDKDWKQKTPQRPFFFWLHLYDPHSPYDPPEPFRSQYREHPYDGEIAYADHELGRLIAWLKQNHIYDNSLIVFLSDHGESLGDHGEKEHGFFVYDSTVRIPLIVKPPAGSGIRPSRVARPVETVAVAPTMVGFTAGKNAGVKIPQELTRKQQFQSPGLLEKDASDVTAAYSESFYSFSSFGWSPLHALETSRYHYIEAPVPELYDVEADPQEKNNLASAANCHGRSPQRQTARRCCAGIRSSRRRTRRRALARTLWKSFAPWAMWLIVRRFLRKPWLPDYPIPRTSSGNLMQSWEREMPSAPAIFRPARPC